MKILILCEYGSNFHIYNISHLSKIWLEQGHQVHVSFGLNEPLPEVDIAILHVDRTIVPEEYTHALKDYPIVVNRNVTDISKSVISSYLLSVDDTYDGPVIIKTNNNFFGYREQISQYAGHKITEALTWENITSLKTYLISKSLNEVPPDIWNNKSLVVEKFLPERNKEGGFCLRGWTFLGNKELYYISTSSNPVIKGDNIINREYLPTELIPREVRDKRKILGFDYGKFDFTIHGGKPILFDVNKTAGIRAKTIKRDGFMERATTLSNGILSFL